MLRRRKRIRLSLSLLRRPPPRLMMDDEEDWTVVSDKKDAEEEAVKVPEQVSQDQGSLYPDLPKTETASAPAVEAEVTPAQAQVTHTDPRIQVSSNNFTL